MNKLKIFIDQNEMKEHSAAVRLNVSQATIYNNLKTDQVSGSMLKRIEIATEEIRREKAHRLASQIARDSTELSQLTAT